MTTDVLPERHPNLVIAEFEAEFVVFDPRDNRVHHLRELAAVVFDACDGSTPVAALVAEICEVAASAAPEVERAVQQALQVFADEGLLSGTEPPTPPPCIGCDSAPSSLARRRRRGRLAR